MSLTYYLPETRVILTAVIEHVSRSWVKEPERHIVSTSVEWLTCADEQWHYELSPELSSLFHKYEMSFAFSPDRRLVGANASSSSRVVDVVSGTVKTLSTIASLFPAFALLNIQLAEVATEAEANAKKQLYALDGDIGNGRKLLTQTRYELCTARNDFIDARNFTPDEQSVVYRRVIRLTTMVKHLEAELDGALEAKAAWREQNTMTRTETISTELEMRHLPIWDIDSKSIIWDSAAKPGEGRLSAQEMWKQARFTLARTPPPRETKLADTGDEGVVVRLPRKSAFRLLQQRDTEEETNRESSLLERIIFRSVLDDRCATEFVKFDKKLLGDVKVALGFDADGLLSGISSSSEGNPMKLLLGAQDGIREGLGSAKEITENLAALQAHSQTTRVAGLERDLAEATKRLELEKIAVKLEEIGKTASSNQ